MHQANQTKNQHFLSQVEQRLNALNPSAPNDKQRIFSFSLADRETYRVTLGSPRGRKISQNLALHDLFSFDVIENSSDRFNFEALFGEYEARLRIDTVELLRKLELGIPDIKTEIIEIFVIKFMNFLRNPYSVKKVLNNIGGLLNFHPTDPEILKQYNAVLAGKKPQQERLCSQLGITPGEYQAWLSALFMALIRLGPGELNLMDSIVKGLFEKPSHFTQVFVYQYVNEHSDKRCLLSDRGYSSIGDQSEHLSFDFNLCSNAFISYVFFDVEKAALGGMNAQYKDLYKQQPKDVKVIPAKNDLSALSAYNKRVVYQCFRNVYSSSKTIYGVNEN